MKKFFVLTIIFLLAFTACEESPNNGGYEDEWPVLTVKNESSYDLTKVSFSGHQFSEYGSDNLLKTKKAERRLTKNDVNNPAYIFFTLKDADIACRTADKITITKDHIFVFEDDTLVEEIENPINKKTLREVASLQAIALEYDDREIHQEGTISIGDVVITQSKEITITIKNIGTRALIITTADITITGTNANLFSKITNPDVNIQPGRESSFIIKYEPVNPGENNATLTIPTNDDIRNPIIVHLRGMAVKGSIIFELRQDSTVIVNDYAVPFDFGQIELGNSKSLTFTIKNNGNLPLELTGNPPIVSTNNIFIISTQPTNKTINPGATASFVIQYTPVAVREYAAVITIPNNSNDTVFSLNVKGIGKKSSYSIGEIGPGGGIVFSVEGNQYKECSPADLGKYNFNDALTVASSYRGGSFTDWQLPDIYDLEDMYENLKRKNMGGFSNEIYWAKSYYLGFVFPEAFDFLFGKEEIVPSQYNTYYVRAVRSFTLN